VKRLDAGTTLSAAERELGCAGDAQPAGRGRTARPKPGLLSAGHGLETMVGAWLFLRTPDGLAQLLDQLKQPGPRTPCPISHDPTYERRKAWGRRGTVNRFRARSPRR